MASVGLILNPEQKVFNSNGTIDQSAAINFYTSGASSVKQKVYHDKDSEVPHGNPLSYSDLNGSAVIYGDPSVTYRQVTVSGAGSTLFTVDTVTPIMPREQLSSAMDVSTYSIVSDSGVNIPLAPSGSGQVVLDGLYFPSQDGAPSQLLTTTGDGTLYWGSTSGVSVVADTTPQLGGALDGNSYSIKIDTNTGIKDESGNEQLIFNTTSSAANYFTITNTATGTSPLLSVGGSDINIPLRLSPSGTGAVSLSGLLYPKSDGVQASRVVTSGDGTLYFSSTVLTLSQVTNTVKSNDQVLASTDSGYTRFGDIVPSKAYGGTTLQSKVFTPRYSSSTLMIKVTVYITPLGSIYAGLNLFNSSSSSSLCSVASWVAANETKVLHLVHFEPAASTSARTYSAGIFSSRESAGVTSTIQINATSSFTTDFGGTFKTYMTIEEFFP